MSLHTMLHIDHELINAALTNLQLYTGVRSNCTYTYKHLFAVEVSSVAGRKGLLTAWTQREVDGLAGRDHHHAEALMSLIAWGAKIGVGPNRFDRSSPYITHCSRPKPQCAREGCYRVVAVGPTTKFPYCGYSICEYQPVLHGLEAKYGLAYIGCGVPAKPIHPLARDVRFDRSSFPLVTFYSNLVFYHRASARFAIMRSTFPLSGCTDPDTLFSDLIWES